MTWSHPARSLAALALLLACEGPGHPIADPPASPTPAPTTTPANPPAPPPPVASPTTPAAPLPSTCKAPFVVAPPYPDTYIDDATKYPARALAPWRGKPMRGPFATRDEIHQGGCTDRSIPAAPPFTEVVHCITGDMQRPPGPDNEAEHLLLVRTAGGWWSQSLARTRWPHDRDQDPQIPHTRDVTVADRLGDGNAEVTAIAELGPPGGSKLRTVFLCGVGPSGAPACHDIRVAAGGPFHGDGAMLYHLTIGCDAALLLKGWEGGDPLKLIHARTTLELP